MHSNTDKSKDKFFVDNLLETHNFNRKRRKAFGEDINQLNKEEEEDNIQSLISVKKPNLKFGIDSILKNSKEEHSLRPPLKYDGFQPLSSSLLIPASGSSPSDYYFNRNSAQICYESQCMSAFNKPILQNYQYFYCNSYASNNPIGANNIGDGNYSPIQNNYNFSSYYNQSGVRNGDQSAAQSGKSKKAKWNRAVFTNLQRQGLERRFKNQKYITKPDRRKLAAMLSLSDSQVKVWFQNRRMKWRHSKEYREELSKTATNKEQQLLTNFPVNKAEENSQN